MGNEFKSEMTGLERALAALSYKKPDRVPVASLVCGAARRVLGVTYDKWSQDADLIADSLLQTHQIMNNEFDIFVMLVDLSVEAGSFGQKVIFPIESTAYADPDDPLIKTVDDYRRIPRINPRETGRMKVVIEATAKVAKAKAKEYGVCGFVYAPLGVIGAMRGHEKMFIDCIKNRDAIIEACEIITPVLEEYAVAQVEAGAQAIVIDTLYASATIMSPKMWEAIEAPFAKRIADAVRKAGGAVVLHNCGGGIYFDVQQKWTNPVAISHAYPAADCKTWEEHAAKWGKKIVSIGYLEPAKVGMFWNEEQVMEEARKCIETYKDCDGGFILSTGCEFPPNGTLINAMAIIKAAKAYGSYK
ncbi:MtaA/CmuA family methyltransferase [Thermincola ferriacetica]|uniref:MtaA/CmuA family methyltransferase n=1 Tax=Thermincola ferriacetica TaxID=281456 RepID=A0A0L6W1D3_9FIRM|nr:uroporphyrinogen decarboxylase family protein [Thermincola ferriacetica]KNZ69387.1 MtaA/CmuA family methyltransferase [Thermincola ferriacetica]